MKEIVTQIYAPSLYWFKYQYHTGLVVSGDSKQSPELSSINPQWIEKQYQAIFAAFAIEQEFSIREDRPSRCFDLLQGNNQENTKNYEYFTTKNGELDGFIYPQSIHDSYALNLNIRCPENPGNDQYSITDLANFNPENCFKTPSETPDGYLGQTLLLSAYLDQPRPKNSRDLDYLAKQCWCNFFALENPEKLPPLYRTSNLFGGYIYEYGNPKINSSENPYGHLLIWFFFDDNPTFILEKCYWELPELFLYYHKISNTFQESRFFYDRANKIVIENESKLNHFQQKHLDRKNIISLSDDDLQTLKNTLKTLLKNSLNYSQQLRNLEYARNTIAINTKNYQSTLVELEQLAQNSLDTFQFFADKEAIAFQEQIAADLNYFKQGSSLLDKAIATIRGLVEIDQAERDRDRLETEKKLKDNIEAIGVGIATGAILASSSGVITQPWYLFDRKIELPFSLPHPFFIAVFGSTAVAIAAWKLTKWIQKRLNMNPKE